MPSHNTIIPFWSFTNIFNVRENFICVFIQPFKKNSKLKKKTPKFLKILNLKKKNANFKKTQIFQKNLN